MQIGKFYEITKEIKIHTKPLATVQIKQTGRFVRETATYYIFSNFRVNKRNVISLIRK